MAYKFNPFSGTLDYTKDIIRLAVMPASITFENNYVIGTRNTPISSVLPSFSYTGALVGNTVTIYHTSATRPVYPATALYTEGFYIPNALNEITFTYLGNNGYSVSVEQISTSNAKDIGLGAKYLYRRGDNGGTAITVATGTESVIASTIYPSAFRMVVVAVGDAKGRGLLNHGTSNFFTGSYNWAYNTKFYFETLSNGTNGYVGASGFLSTAAANPSTDGNCITFLYSDTINSGRLQVRIKTSGQTEILLDTGVTVVANTLYECQLEMDSELRVYVNGVLTNTQAINVQFPAAAGRFMQYAWKTVGSGSVNSMVICEQILATY